jgi:hypothetical protein
VEIAVEMGKAAKKAGTVDSTPMIGLVLLVIGLWFVWRSFYAMLIPKRTEQ